MLSSRNPSALPAPDELERRCQAMTVLEAILCPEPRWRYFAFNAAFAPGERVARANSATGDGQLIWFAPQGVVIRGFDHESPVSPWGRDPVAPWPGLFDGLPEKLRHGPRLEVDGVESVTFCLWWDLDDLGWRSGVVAQPDAEYADPDGSEWLLAELDGPAAYQIHAQEFHERGVPLDAITQLYRHEPLTEQMIRAVDPNADTVVALATAMAVGYPVAEQPALSQDDGMWQAGQAEIAIEGRPHDAGPVEVKGESAGESLQDRLEQARQGWAVGRQVNFFLDRRDLDGFEAFFWSSDAVVGLCQPTPSADLVTASSLRPEAENQLRPWPSMFLARNADLHLIRVRLIEQQGYYLIDSSLFSPVIEWSPAYEPSTGHRSGRGRLWFPTGYWNDDSRYVEMPHGFLRWGDRLLRWVRRNWKKGSNGYYESPTARPG